MSDCVVIDGVTYRQSIVLTEVNGKKLPIKDLIPIFKSEEERNMVKERISNELFRIFRKYVD